MTRTRTRKIDRDYILAEIRRTTADNGGVPLGRVRFQQATGIKPGDWEGRHWVRWGDAVAEAGFERNELNQAYDEGFLLERLASVVSQLGHFPLKAELQMASRADPKFPSFNVFTTRFGNKPQLAAKLLAFCESKADLQGVADLCRPHVAQLVKATEPTCQQTTAEVFGAVYLLRSGRFYKIGRSNAVGRRERELSIQMPERAEVVHEIRTDDPAGIEAYWHGRFASKRTNGEWFRLSGDDLAAFKRRRFM